MTSVILLTGGTGTLGSLIVPRLRAAGQDVRVLSRSRHEARTGVEYVTGDVAKNRGVEAAVTGVEAIIHAAGSSKGDEIKTSNLVDAAAQAGVRHIAYISVVGADIKSFGYFVQKPASERIIADSGIPWTTLRATQFHDLLLAAGKHRPMLHMRLPGKGANALRAGANLAPNRAVGQRTWEKFLADRVWKARRAERARSGS